MPSQAGEERCEPVSNLLTTGSVETGRCLCAILLREVTLVYELLDVVDGCCGLVDCVLQGVEALQEAS